jgi:aldose 1-epimerase
VTFSFSPTPKAVAVSPCRRTSRGVQLYAGGYLDGATGKAPAGEYKAFAGLTLETQTFPDAVNHSHFPQAELRPGQTYLNSMRFEFSAIAR